MTDYITINGVKKRSFVVNVSMPGRTQATVVNNDDTRIARNSDTRVARNSDIRIAHNVSVGYTQVRTVFGVKKRSFFVRGAKVHHG